MQKAIIGLLAGFLILAPFLNIPEYLFYDNKRLFQLSVFGLIGLFVVYHSFFNNSHYELDKRYLGNLSSKHLILVFVILFVAGIVSVFSSDNSWFALVELFFTFILFSLIYLLRPINRRSHLFLGKFIIATATIYSGLYLIVFFGNYISSFFNPMIILWPDVYDFSININGVILEGKETLFFTHKRFFNHTQTWTIPILVGLVCYHRKQFTNQWVITGLLFLLTSLWWMLILASGGRGSMLSLVLSVLILAFIWRKDLIPFLKYGASTLAAGGIFYFIFFKIIPGVNNNMPLLRSSDSGRLNMWQRAMESWVQNPFFGIGPMHYSEIVIEPYFAHPHNFYIQFLTEWGLIAFIALAFLIGFLIKNVFDNYPDKNQKFQSTFLYISLSWSISAAFIHAFFSGVFHTPMSQIWFVLVCAWFLGFSRGKNAESKTFSVQKYASIVYISLFAVLIFLLYNDFFSIYEGYEDYISKYPDSIFYPRFWGQGLFE